MIGRRLVNGVEGTGVAADDRGLAYGDGLFETMAAESGQLRYFDLHMARLADGCSRLGIPMPAIDVIREDCGRVLEGLGTATVKLIVTRGAGPRGYAPPTEPTVTRIVMSASSHSHDAEAFRPICVQICRTRLAINEQFAGIKHLNRLEQVMASAELRGSGLDEGLMLAMDGRLVCATAANLFLVRGGRLHTPVIRDCGVAGVMRHVVLQAAESLGIPYEIRDLEIGDLTDADEVFLTNAVRGIRPVVGVSGIGQYPIAETVP
ncbi:MAG TPA: aminodeoxychorismate lyase, partial [Steroidobacteraceae bacterium]